MQRFRSLPQSACGLRSPCTGQFTLEFVQIQGTGWQGEQVALIDPRQQAGRGAAGPIGLEYPPQPGNVPLYQVHRVPRRCVTPYGIDHLLAADRTSRLQREYRQNYPLLNGPEIHDGPVPPGSKRPQDADSQRRHARITHVLPPAAQQDSNPT